MKKIQLILVTVFFFAMVSAMAQTPSPRVDARQKAQRGRIAEGRQTGEVTNREGALLNKEQRYIRRSERRVEADGQVTRREKARMERKQDRASRHVRRAKHNEVANKN